MKQQIITAVIVALLVGGSAPWWWSKVFPPTQATSSATNEAVKSSPPSATASPAAGGGSATAQPPPHTTLQKLRSKLLITGSYNEVYFYWDSKVGVRVHEPFTVTTQNEHSHIALPDDIPVDIEFAGHDNTVWCHDSSMVDAVVGSGMHGNKFEVRKGD
jgi:hypothetical protein